MYLRNEIITFRNFSHFAHFSHQSQYTDSLAQAHIPGEASL